MNKTETEYKKGVMFTLASYALWGFFPIYWKSFNNVSAYEILAERIVWAFIFMLVAIICLGKWPAFYQESKTILANRRQSLLLVAAGIIISINWLLFIVAVNSGRIVETSLGYYINPLVSIVLGVYYFKERLSIWTKISFALACCGVAIMAWRLGTIPWISLSLALSFGLYGLLKKLVKTTVVTSITLETLVAMPLAGAYIYYLYSQGISAWQVADNFSLGLLTISGVVTATPLLLFSQGAKMLPLNIVGFLQYISPTISLLIGVFIYQEAFTVSHFWAFGFIWTALALFSISQTKVFQLYLEKLFLK